MKERTVREVERCYMLSMCKRVFTFPVEFPILMKSLILLTTMLSWSAMLTSDVTEHLDVSGPLDFNDTSFELAWSDQPNKDYYIQEYLPAGETLESFDQMLTLHVFDTKTTVKEGIGQKINELNKRKETDPTCNFAVQSNPDESEYIIDFVLGESEGDEMTIVEFNVYRYKRVKIGKRKEGLLVYAYSKRAYGGDILPFMKGLKEARSTHINQMIAAEVPAILIK